MQNTRFRGSVSTVGMGISFALVFIGMGVTVYNSMSGGSTGYSPSGKIALYCMAEKKGFEVTRQEYQDLLEKSRKAAGKNVNQGPMGPAGMMEMMTPWGQFPRYPMVCPKCGKKACFSAAKCKKCRNIFIPYKKDAKGQYKYDDTCPKCHYSRIKEVRAKRRAERAKRRKE